MMVGNDPCSEKGYLWAVLGSADVRKRLTVGLNSFGLFTAESSVKMRSYTKLTEY